MMLPSRQKNRKSDSVSPILEQIMTGGSSISFNVLHLSTGIEPENYLFKTSALNNSIIFKYPNFTDIQGDSSALDEEAIPDEAFVRPIETGIYVPHTNTTPRAGGYAVYLRSKNYRLVMEDLFGIGNGGTPESNAHDLSILDAIDSVPSLDAFLLKTVFESERIAIDQRYLRINEDEERQIRMMIGDRIEPIICRALDVQERGGRQTERFLHAIWHTDMPEARLFVSAFGIEHSEADSVFGAWKGITFYEYQLRRLAPAVRNITRWLKSENCLPIDLRYHRMFEKNLLMYIEKIGKQVNEVLNDIRNILGEYETCFSTFMEGNPNLFRDFLRTVRQKYWLMGYCISSLNSITHTYKRFMRNSVNNQLFFDPMHDMLRQFDVALDRRREQRTSF